MGGGMGGGGGGGALGGDGGANLSAGQPGQAIATVTAAPENLFF